MKPMHRVALGQAIHCLKDAENCLYLVYVDTPKEQGSPLKERAQRIEALWKEIQAELEQPVESNEE